MRSPDLREQIGAVGAIDEDRVRKDRVLGKRVPDRRMAHTKSSRRKPRGEHVQQRGAVDAIEPRHKPQNAGAGKLRDRAHVIGIVVADENKPMQPHVTAAQRFDREQRVVDRPKPGSRAENQRQAQSANTSICSLLRVIGTNKPPAPSTISVRSDAGNSQRFRLDLDAVELGGAMRRERLRQNITLGQEAIVRQLRQRLHVLRGRCLPRCRTGSVSNKTHRAPA